MTPRDLGAAILVALVLAFIVGVIALGLAQGV